MLRAMFPTTSPSHFVDVYPFDISVAELELRHNAEVYRERSPHAQSLAEIERLATISHAYTLQADQLHSNFAQHRRLSPEQAMFEVPAPNPNETHLDFVYRMLQNRNLGLSAKDLLYSLIVKNGSVMTDGEKDLEINKGEARLAERYDIENGTHGSVDIDTNAPFLENVLHFLPSTEQLPGAELSRAAFKQNLAALISNQSDAQFLAGTKRADDFERMQNMGENQNLGVVKSLLQHGDFEAAQSLVAAKRESLHDGAQWATSEPMDASTLLLAEAEYQHNAALVRIHHDADIQRLNEQADLATVKNLLFEGDLQSALARISAKREFSQEAALETAREKSLRVGQYCEVQRTGSVLMNTILPALEQNHAKETENFIVRLMKARYAHLPLEEQNQIATQLLIDHKTNPAYVNYQFFERMRRATTY